MPSTCLQPPSACQSCNKDARILFPRSNRWLCLNCNLAKVYAPQEIIARTKRVYLLAEWLERANITGDEARRMDAEDWANIAHRLGINPPSLETISYVVQTLEAVRAIEAIRPLEVARA